MSETCPPAFSTLLVRAAHARGSLWGRTIGPAVGRIIVFIMHSRGKDAELPMDVPSGTSHIEYSTGTLIAEQTAGGWRTRTWEQFLAEHPDGYDRYDPPAAAQLEQFAPRLSALTGFAVVAGAGYGYLALVWKLISHSLGRFRTKVCSNGWAWMFWFAAGIDASENGRPSEVTPNDVEQYLISHGWTRVPT